ncbi:MAG: hypothetical protein RLY31_441 [Bacteroidota bacterium]|jgi:GTP-binding protein
MKHPIAATYAGSYPDLAACPEADKPEYAMTGRSNVGKSSLINMLCQHKGLAHVSHRPGKTQTINFFSLADKWHLVDLPGFGYAKISRRTRQGWHRMVTEYLLKRPSLACVFVLVDSSIEPNRLDIEFANWLGEHQIPFVLVFTKADKLPGNQLRTQVDRFLNTLGEHWNELPPHFVTSSARQTGRESLLDFIDEVNGRLQTPQA